MFSEKHQHKIKKRQQFLDESLLTFFYCFLSVDDITFYSITLIDIFCNWSVREVPP